MILYLKRKKNTKKNAEIIEELYKNFLKSCKNISYLLLVIVLIQDSNHSTSLFNSFNFILTAFRIFCPYSSKNLIDPACS